MCRNVKKFLSVRRDLLLVSCFRAWRTYCRDNLHRRLALVNRLSSFQRVHTLRYFLFRLRTICCKGLYLRRKGQEVQKRFLGRVWRSWKLSLKTRLNKRRRKRLCLTFLLEVADRGGTRAMRRALNVWKLRVYCAGKHSRASRMHLLKGTFSLWYRCLLAVRHRSGVLKAKAFSRWVGRLHTIAGAREAVLARQRGATMVRMRFKRVVYQQLLSAFARWRHFVRLGRRAGHDTTGNYPLMMCSSMSLY